MMCRSAIIVTLSSWAAVLCCAWGDDERSGAVNVIKSLDGSPRSLQKIYFEGSIDTAIAADPGGFVLAITDVAVPEPIRYYVAAKVIGTKITNEQSLIAHGILFNDYIASDAAQGWALLAEYYHTLPPELDDADLVIKMREAHWKISDLEFATFTAGKKKTGSRERINQAESVK